MSRLVLFLIGVFTIMSGHSQTSTKNAATMNGVDDIYRENMQDSVLVTGWYFVEKDSIGFERQLEKTEDVYFINPHPIVVASNFKKVALEKNIYNDFYLSISLDKVGTRAWAEATLKATGRKLGFILNNRLLYVPHINSQITGGMTAVNSSNYTKEEYEEFKRLIGTGGQAQTTHIKIE